MKRTESGQQLHHQRNDLDNNEDIPEEIKKFLENLRNMSEDKDIEFQMFEIQVPEEKEPDFEWLGDFLEAFKNGGKSLDWGK